MLRTKAGRAWISAFICGVTLDVLVACLVSSFLDSRDRWFGFFATLAILWVGPIVLGIKSLIYKTLFFFLTRGGVRSALVQEFRKAQLPLLSGTGYNSPADLYFTEVAQDDDLPQPARLFAAQSLGQFALIPTYSLPDSFILHANVDAALAIYFDEMRRDGVKARNNDF